jgi:hypothetical protein
MTDAMTDNEWVECCAARLLALHPSLLCAAALRWAQGLRASCALPLDPVLAADAQHQAAGEPLQAG